MKRGVTLFLALILALSAATAFAAGARVEGIEYMGFGIVEIDFSQDCDWYQSATIALTDASGAEFAHEIVGGEADNCYLRVPTLEAGTSCTLNFSLDGASQSIAFDAVTGVEYKVLNDGTVRADVEKERCDFCGEAGHDEDFCPKRIDANDLPEDPDAFARLFDLDRCERCGGIGHDDDHCPN